MNDKILELFEYIFSTPGSTAIFFSIIISSILSILIFLASGWRERRKASREFKLKKIEELFYMLHRYSRTSKKYLWSIKREKQNIVRDRQLAEEARELLYECEVFKHLYFKTLPLDTALQYAEMERIGGECDKIWMKVPAGSEIDIQHNLDACKAVGNEVKKLDDHLKPIIDKCLEIAENNRNFKA